MIFVDANVFMYFVGQEHPLRDEARAFFHRSTERDTTLVTSAEVLQEILHRYLGQGRSRVAVAAFELVEATTSDIWPVDHDDVSLALNLAHRYPGLEARDLVHLAGCMRRKARGLVTFDRGLAAAWDSLKA